MRKTLIGTASFCAAVALGLSTLMQAAPAPATAFVDAAMQGNKDAVRNLLKDGADVKTTTDADMTDLR
jgi:hypothetical protein